MYLLVEVAGKALWVPYIERHHRNDPERLKTEKKTLELRLVYEAIGEKMCIMTGPFIAIALAPTMQGDDDDAHFMTPSELAEVGTWYLAMEEVVDALVLVMMARFNIYALRVRPTLSARVTLNQGLLCSCIFGFIKMGALGTA